MVEEEHRRSLMQMPYTGIATAPARLVLARERGQAVPASLFLTPATLLVLMMLLLPLLLLLRFSLNRFDPVELMIEMVTAENYIRFLSDPFYLSVMRTTLVVAVASTLICLLLGLPIAYRLARSQSRWKGLFMLAMVLPLFVGSTVRMVGWMILFAHGGMIDALWRSVTGQGMELMYTSAAVICGIVSINLPFVVLTIQSAIETIDPRIEEAAQSLGAAPDRRFWRVVWPLALPGTATAGILCFILAMNAYATPFLIGGPRFQMMAPILYWEFSTNNNWPFASALALILMATTLILTACSGLLIPRRYRV
jgi:putative spermidine/putrescine transport system permease protein